MASRFIIGLDIGTSWIKAIVAEQREKTLLCHQCLREPSSGVRRGGVVDPSQLLPPVSRLIQAVKKFSKAAAKNIYVNLGTSQVKSQLSRGIIAVSRSDSEIYPDDVERVIKASQAINLAPNRMIVHTITREFVVDGIGDIVDPLGLTGNRLEVSSLILDSFTPHVKSVVKIVEQCGGQVSGMVFNPLAAARCALSRRQKDLGVAIVDIGAATTEVTVYEENKLISVATFPVGSSHISNDIAIGLKIPVDVAELLKIEYGCALAKSVGLKEMVDVSQLYPDAKGPVSRRFLSEIVESRLAEIFEFINNELKSVGKYAQLAGGVVFVGAGSKIPKLLDLARQELKLSVQMGSVIAEEWQMDSPDVAAALQDPDCTVAAGLALWGADQSGTSASFKLPEFSIKNIVRYFIP